jgi:hypothetical protein
MPLVAYHCAIVLFDKIVVCTNVYFVIAKESEAMPTDRLYIKDWYKSCVYAKKPGFFVETRFLSPRYSLTYLPRHTHSAHGYATLIAPVIEPPIIIQPRRI